MKGVRWEEGAFARAQGRGGVWRCLWGVRKGKRSLQGARGVRKSKKRVYDFFPTDVRFFANLNFMYIFIIIFEG